MAKSLLPRWDLAIVAEALTEAAIDPSRWVRAMDLLAEQTGSVGTVLMPAKGVIPHKVLSESIEGLSEAYFREEWFKEDIRFRPAALSTFTQQGAFDERHYTNEDELRRHPYFRDLLDRFRLRWSATLKMQAGEDVWALGLQRSYDQGPLSDDELAKLRQFSNFLSTVGAAAKALGFARVEATLNAFEVSGAPVMLLDREGRVFRMNAAAGRLQGDDLQVSQGRIRLRAKAASRALDAMLHRLFWQGRESAPLGSVVVIPREGRQPLLAYPTRLPGVQLDALGPCQAMIVFQDPELRLQPTVATMKQSFGLTDAEARLALHVSAGKTLSEIARDNSVSPVTVRNQLGAAMKKIGVRRQAELVAVIAAMAPPV